MNRLTSRGLSWRILLVLRRNTTYTTNTQGTGYRVKGFEIPIRLDLVVSCWSRPAPGHALAFGQSARKGEYEVYPCRYKPAHDVEKLLSDLLPADPSVHLVVDEKSNALLLRGPAEAQKIAQTLLQHVDRPDAAPTNSQPGTTVVKAYDVPPAADLDRSLGVVRALCGQRGDVKVNLVAGHPPDHRARAAGITCGDCRAVCSEATTRVSFLERTLRQPVRPLPSSADTERVLPLRALDAEGMEQRLIALFGRRLHVAQRDGSEVFVLPVAPQRVLEFSVDRARRMVHARGPEPLVSQFATLVDALDAGGQPGQKTRALHVERTAPQQLEEAVDAYRGRVPETPPPESNRQ